MVASVASSRSTISSVPIQPKSRAVTVASRYIPMFVGEVRCATTGRGIVLEVVGRQPVVLGPDEGLEEPPGPAGGQAERRRCRRPTAAPRPISAGGRLTHRATSGDSSHRTMNGAAIQAALGFRTRTRTAATAAIADAARHLPVEPGEVEVVAGLGLRGGRPLEQVPPGDVAAAPGSARSRRPSATPGGRGT